MGVSDDPSDQLVFPQKKNTTIVQVSADPFEKGKKK